MYFLEFSRMSQHGYMRHTVTPPLVLDLIRLIQSASCGSINNFYLLTISRNLYINLRKIIIEHIVSCHEAANWDADVKIEKNHIKL